MNIRWCFIKKLSLKNERETTSLTIKIVNLTKLLAFLPKTVPDFTGITYLLSKGTLK